MNRLVIQQYDSSNNRRGFVKIPMSPERLRKSIECLYKVCTDGCTMKSNGECIIKTAIRVETLPVRSSLPVTLRM